MPNGDPSAPSDPQCRPSRPTGAGIDPVAALQRRNQRAIRFLLSIKTSGGAADGQQLWNTRN
ncbi:hypothetical protein H4S01_003239, partial [Coemansia sp. RSA 2610]